MCSQSTFPVLEFCVLAYKKKKKKPVPLLSSVRMSVRKRKGAMNPTYGKDQPAPRIWPSAIISPERPPRNAHQNRDFG